MEEIDFISNAEGRQSSKLSTVITNVAWFFISLILYAVLGCLEWVNGAIEINWGVFSDLSWWGVVALKALGTILAYNVALNWFMPIAERFNHLLKRDQIAYDGLNSIKEEKSFDEYVYLKLNREEKMRVWVSKINRKIHRAGIFARAKSKTLWGIPESKLTEKDKERKAKNRYCRRMAYLTTLKSQEWMEANIDSVHIWFYRPIEPSVFNLSIDGKENGTRYKVMSHVGVAKLVSTSTIVLSTVMFTVFMSIWIIDMDKLIEMYEKNKAFMIAILIANLGFILSRMVKGAFNSRKIVENEIHRPYCDRIRILDRYFRSEYKPDGLDYKEAKEQIYRKANSEVRLSMRDKKREKPEKSKEDTATIYISDKM